MKRLFTLLLILTMALSLTACGNANSEPEIKQDNSSSITESGAVDEQIEDPANGATISPEASSDSPGNSTEPSDSGKKVLVAYFSATGTTKKIAEYAAAAMSADIYEIVPATPYTSDDLNYNADDCRANTEMNDPSCRPEIDGSVDNMADYDIVFIGYPIWWGETPRIVSTFVESYDFSGKTVVTFCTSGSSGLNDSSIKELASGAHWITGTRLKGNSSESDIIAWITDLGLDIPVK